MRKKLSPHIALHERPHHVTAIGNIILAEGLDDVRKNKNRKRYRKHGKDICGILCEYRPCHAAKYLRIHKIHAAYHDGADEVEYKYPKIRSVVRQKSA